MNVVAKDIEVAIQLMRLDTYWLNVSFYTAVGNDNVTFAGKELPFYFYGHPLEINTRLTEKNKDKEEKHLKYPAIFLKLDTVEDVDGKMIHYKLNLAIVNETKRNYNAEQRLDNVFIPILNRLYEAFFKSLRDCGKFTWETFGDMPKHKKIDRYFYGTQGQNKNNENYFSDPLDAIEIVDLEISAHKRSGVNCLNPTK